MFMEKENKSKEEELREELRLLDEAEGDLIRMEEYLNKMAVQKIGNYYFLRKQGCDKPCFLLLNLLLKTAGVINFTTALLLKR